MSDGKKALVGLIDHFAGKIALAGQKLAGNLADGLADNLAKRAAKAASKLDRELDAIITPTHPRKVKRGKKR